MRQRIFGDILVTKPTRGDVQNLKVGDLAPDVFGRMSEIVKIFALGIDRNKKAYVCFYTKLSGGSSISHSMTEDEIVSTLPLTNRFKTRAEAGMIIFPEPEAVTA